MWLWLVKYHHVQHIYRVIFIFINIIVYCMYSWLVSFCLHYFDIFLIKYNTLIILGTFHCLSINTRAVIKVISFPVTPVNRIITVWLYVQKFNLHFYIIWYNSSMILLVLSQWCFIWAWKSFRLRVGLPCFHLRIVLSNQKNWSVLTTKSSWPTLNGNRTSKISMSPLTAKRVSHNNVAVILNMIPEIGKTAWINWTTVWIKCNWHQCNFGSWHFVR